MLPPVRKDMDVVNCEVNPTSQAAPLVLLNLSFYPQDMPVPTFDLHQFLELKP